jgi:hypothetical protein
MGNHVAVLALLCAAACGGQPEGPEHGADAATGDGGDVDGSTVDAAYGGGPDSPGCLEGCCDPRPTCKTYCGRTGLAVCPEQSHPASVKGWR